MSVRPRLPPRGPVLSMHPASPVLTCTASPVLSMHHQPSPEHAHQPKPERFVPSTTASPGWGGESPLSHDLPDPKLAVRSPFCILSTGRPLAPLLQLRATARRRNNECTYLEVSRHGGSGCHLCLRFPCVGADDGARCGYHGAIPQRLARQVLPQKDESRPGVSQALF